MVSVQVAGTTLESLTCWGFSIGCPIITVHQFPGTRHAMVIKGYNIHPEHGELVIYNDPWDGRGHSITYDDYLDGDVSSWLSSIFWC